MTDTTIETIGCDLGDKRTTICILTADGSLERMSVRTTRTAMRRLFTRPRSHVVLEVGVHSRWMSALMQELGHRVTVANPRRLQLISQNPSKSDEHDAELLARLGRADVELLSPIEHRSLEAHADLEVLKARDVLVASRTQLVNHVRSVVKNFGERLPKCTAESFHRRVRELVPAELQAALAPLFDALEKITEQVRRYDRMIGTLAKKHAASARLSQVHGVGPLTALAFLLTVETPERFNKSRTVGAFFGLRPRRGQSGAADPQLRITKAGDRFVRKLLVTSANYILGPFGKDSDLRRWGLHLAERGGKNARKRAKVAVARKLAVLLHRLWVSGEPYVPIGYHVGQRVAA